MHYFYAHDIYSNRLAYNQHFIPNTLPFRPIYPPAAYSSPHPISIAVHSRFQLVANSVEAISHHSFQHNTSNRVDKLKSRLCGTTNEDSIPVDNEDIDFLKSIQKSCEGVFSHQIIEDINKRLKGKPESQNTWIICSKACRIVVKSYSENDILKEISGDKLPTSIREKESLRDKGIYFFIFGCKNLSRNLEEILDYPVCSYMLLDALIRKEQGKDLFDRYNPKYNGGVSREILCQKILQGYHFRLISERIRATFGDDFLKTIFCFLESFYLQPSNFNVDFSSVMAFLTQLETAIGFDLETEKLHSLNLEAYKEIIRNCDHPLFFGILTVLHFNVVLKKENLDSNLLNTFILDTMIHFSEKKTEAFWKMLGVFSSHNRESKI